jgi:hypothetical protein
MSIINVLPGGIQSATVGAIGFDCDIPLTHITAKAFVDNGYNFVVRYLSLGPSQRSGDLTTIESAAILESGLALMAVQHVAYEGWQPNQSLGQTNGQNAVNNAQSIGVPQGINVWLDLEGINLSTTSTDVISYCNTWFNIVQNAGYIPGLYVGANCILNSDQLFYNLHFRYYWKSGSNVPNVTNRGYCMVQHISNSYVIDGVPFDKNIIQADNMGNTPFWLTLIPPTQGLTNS